MTRTMSVILRIAVASLLYWAVDRHPMDYYTLLRWVVCGSAVYMFFRAKELGNNEWQWVFGIVALFFNPLFLVNLSKGTWNIIDLIASAIFVVSVFLMELKMNKIRRVIVMICVFGVLLGVGDRPFRLTPNKLIAAKNEVIRSIREDVKNKNFDEANRKLNTWNKEHPSFQIFLEDF